MFLEGLPDAGRARTAAHREAWGLRLLGDIHSRQDPPAADQAEGVYRQAITLADELGMRPLVARCHLGSLYRAAGRRTGAQQHLATAMAMYRDMDMRFWLEQTGAEIREAS